MKIRDIGVKVSKELLVTIKNAIDDFTSGEGGSPDGWIMSLAFSSVAWQLDGDSRWSVPAQKFKWWKVQIGVLAGITLPSWSFNLGSKWLTKDIKNSEYWNYNIDDVYDQGTEFDPVKKTKNWELIADALMILVGIVVIFVLRQLGQEVFCNYLGKRLLSDTKSTNRLAQIYTDTQYIKNKSDTIDSATGTTNSNIINAIDDEAEGSLANVLKVTKTLLTAAKVIIDKVDVQVLTEGDPIYDIVTTISEAIGTDVATMFAKLNEIILAMKSSHYPM